MKSVRDGTHHKPHLLSVFCAATHVFHWRSGARFSQWHEMNFDPLAVHNWASGSQNNYEPLCGPGTACQEGFMLGFTRTLLMELRHAETGQKYRDDEVNYKLFLSVGLAFISAFPRCSFQHFYGLQSFFNFIFTRLGLNWETDSRWTLEPPVALIWVLSDHRSLSCNSLVMIVPENVDFCHCCYCLCTKTQFHILCSINHLTVLCQKQLFSLQPCCSITGNASCKKTFLIVFSRSR